MQKIPVNRDFLSVQPVVIPMCPAHVNPNVLVSLQPMYEPDNGNIKMWLRKPRLCRNDTVLIKKEVRDAKERSARWRRGNCQVFTTCLRNALLRLIVPLHHHVLNTNQYDIACVTKINGVVEPLRDGEWVPVKPIRGSSS